MDFGNAIAQVTVPNVNIGDCDYTIAFWIRILNTFAGAEIYGWSRSGKLIAFQPNEMSVTYCRAISTATLVYYTCVFGSSGVVMNNWTHIAVTCEQDNTVNIFSNGEIANITNRLNLSDQDVLSFFGTSGPEEMFVIIYYSSTVMMDLHILGSALPPDEIYDLYRG